MKKPEITLSSMVINIDRPRIAVHGPIIPDGRVMILIKPRGAWEPAITLIMPPEDLEAMSLELSRETEAMLRRTEEEPENDNATHAP